MSDIAIEVHGLGKRYWKNSGFALLPRLRKRSAQDEFWSLRDLDFDIHRGEAVGIIGPNGAGKSTLLKIISRIISPSTGEVVLRGRVNSLLEVGTGFQPDLSGRANIYLNASILGLSRKEVDSLFGDIVEFSGVGDFIDMPVRHYSSGMYSRLAFAVAAHITGDILLVDEVLSVGDAEFRRKSLSRMTSLMETEHRTVLFVSHSMDAILRFCQRVIWLNNGQMVAFGSADDVIRDYLNRSNSTTKSLHVTAVSRAAEKTSEMPDDRSIVRIDGEWESSQIARVNHLAIYDVTESPSFAFFRDEPIHIKLTFEIRSPCKLSPFIAVRCLPRKGVCDEVVVFSDFAPSKAYGVGSYSVSVVLPSNLFASGAYYLTVGLITLGSPVIKHHMLKRVLTFQVADREAASEVMGEYVRGIVHPNLIWQI